MVWAAVVLAVVAVRSADATGLRLSRTITSSMVMQAEQPTVFGWANPGAKVRVSTSDGETVTVTAAGPALNGSWLARLTPRPAKILPTGIAVTIVSGADTVTLTDVLFGDVWVCSGQSNMEFSVSEAFDRDAIIAGSAIDGLRLFAVQKNSSSIELDDVVDVMTPGGGWARSSRATVCGAEYDNDGYSPTNKTAYCGPHCGPSAAVKSFHRATWGYFSAACYLHGRALLRETGRPQGMLESCWGGTTIQAWSSAAALQACNSSTAVTAAAFSNLWSGMITPLLKLPIKGAIWYQGEANTHSTFTGNNYFCQMTEMISDWRARWHAEGNADATFPFIIAMLAPAGGGYSPVLRYSQWGTAAASYGRGSTREIGAADVPRITNVGVANLIDLFDAGSPCGSVHIRNKTMVGERLAAAALAIGYNQTVSWNGPVPVSFTSNGSAVTISYVTSNGSPAQSLSFASLWWNNQTTDPSSQNFEVLVGNGSWVDAAATVGGSGGSVVVRLSDPADAPIQAVRYAWAENPSGQQLFEGGTAGLPAMSFIATCTDGACALMAPGAVPDYPPSKPPRPSPGPPAPPAPPSTACAIKNNTVIQGSKEIAQATVPFLDSDACCGVCRGFKGCAAAQLMGSGSRNPPFTHSLCYLYGSVGTETGYHCPYPCARIAVVPT